MKLNNINKLDRIDKSDGINKSKTLTDHDLNQKVKSLAIEERKLTKEILLYIAEVDKRRLYLRMAYPSLYEYLTKEIGYSEGAAQRRIDAARLMQKVPEVSSKIADGSLHLAQISKVQKICRLIRKESGSPVELATQKIVLEKLENKTSIQTDLILAQEFQIEVKASERKVIQQDESVRIELTLTKEEAELLKKAQELLSNKTGGSLKNTLIEMAQRIVKSYEPKTKVKLNHKSNYEPKTQSNGADENKNEFKSKESTTFTATVAVDKKALKKKAVELKSVTPRLKKEILERDQCCQFKNPKTGKICGSKHFLEIDHIQPRFLDGAHTSANLRVLCKNHNIFRYSAGI